MTGIPAPYNMVNDNILMLLFVLNLIGMAYVFIMNGGSLTERIKSMFYYGKSSNPFNDRTHITGICNTLLYWQTRFYCAILTLGYMQYGQVATSEKEAQTTFFILTAIFAIFLLLKRVIYDACNLILFGHQQAQEWRQSYFFTIKLIGFMLFPLVSCILFVKGFNKEYFTTYIIFVTLAHLFTFISNSIKIIFHKKRNYLDIILYLCALEFLPMAILWRLIGRLGVFLTIKI